MLNSFKSLIKDVCGSLADTQPGADPQTSNGMATATAMLLVEVSWADHDIRPEEEEQMVAHMQHLFPALSVKDIEQELAAAIVALKESTGLHPFTQAINEQASLVEKLDLMKALWSIAHADGKTDAHEEHLIRRIADLLHVRHSEFIASKKAARKL